MAEEKPLKSPIAKNEEKILQFWKENKIFEKTLAKNSPNGEFVFYDGPATANGKPGIHHLEPQAFKDVIPRYKTMRGFHVSRRIGWDTHGLPVELQVEKALGLKSKKEIEVYGIEAFNKKCKESVWEYIDVWKKFTDRNGYWVDQEHPYITYENSYIESVWNILKTVNEKKLLYKDYKVLPWCPRCGTALSSHELAQGYQDDKDLAVTVKFEVVGQENTYLLAWTTTPWTLPGNVALAVGKETDYVKVRVEDDFLILAKSRLSVLDKKHEILEEMKGKRLIGLKYEPLYNFLLDKFKDRNPKAFEKSYQVYEANFVNTEEGTGIVHTAVMYGQDDFVLGTEVGLPKFHLVDENGHFLSSMDFLSERFVKNEDVAVDIVKDLAHRGLLLKKEKYEHSYPHCWRCKTPLIYYARDSWYIKMSYLRDELIKENKNINWEPEHIKNGRFGEWLREIKDWAISRERYWGTPLPIWQNPNGEVRVIGSIDELKKYTKKSGNNYFVMRHGQTEENLKTIWSLDSKRRDPLTEAGGKKVKENGRTLKDKSIDVIIVSPYVRTRESAELVAKEIGYPLDKIVTDDRLGEWYVGNEYDGRPTGDFFNVRNISQDRYSFKTKDGESYIELLKRVGGCIYDIEKKYSDKNILIITHRGVARGLSLVTEGFTYEKLLKQSSAIHGFDNAEIRPLDFVPLPHNENYEFDLHRPFIDEVSLIDENNLPLTRVKEVLDVWFDSGAMPFASNAELTRNHEDIAYPADYIAEAIDQTRGWFYTLHAIGVLTGKGNAFKNVICLGHILDSNGKKMSKSLGNIVDPVIMINKYGVDSLRFWMYSVNQPGDSKNFDERTVDEIVKKVFNPLQNVLVLYELYKDDSVSSGNNSQNILDRWILSKMDELVYLGTKSLDEYKIFEATRAIKDFVNDFSTWYIRRSRDRFKSENQEEKREVLSTTRFVFLELAKYMSAITPFFAEAIYQKLREKNSPISVHLSNWPSAGEIDSRLINDMQKAREIVTKALELRQKALIKVRQPLSSLTIGEGLQEDLLTIIADEVNVKEVKISDGEIKLDTTLTPELVEEGKVREVIRNIQEWRKENNLIPGKIVKYSVPESDREFFAKHAEEIKKVTGIEF